MLKIVPPVATSVHDANSLSNTNRNALDHKKGAPYYQTKLGLLEKGQTNNVVCWVLINIFLGYKATWNEQYPKDHLDDNLESKRNSPSLRYR